MAEEKDKRKMVQEKRPSAQRVKRVHPEVALETIREKMANLHEKHANLREALSVSGNAQGAKLSQEFDEARATSSAGEHLLDTAWDDALVQTVFEQANADTETNTARMVYHAGRKSIFILTNRRVGVQFTPTSRDEAQESYYCVMSMKPPAEKIVVNKHNIPFFLPLRELETTHLILSPSAFLDHLDNHLQAFVNRREQILGLRQQHGEHIGELYHSMPYDSVKFSLNHSNLNSEVELGFELESERPVRTIVNVWAVAQVYRRNLGRRGPKSYTASSEVIARRVPTAEELLRTHPLPEAFDELVKEIQTTASVPAEVTLN